MLDNLYISIKNSNKPDKDIEIFWYSLKSMVMNTFEDQPPIDLDNYSQTLNKLQLRKQYIEIEKQIIEYVSHICRIYVVYKCSEYNCNLLHTQLKRWSNIAKKYDIFSSKNSHKTHKDCCIFFIYLKYLRYDDSPEMNDFFSKLSIDSEIDIENLVMISIKYNYDYFLDKLASFENIIDIISKKYSVTIHPKTSGKKILQTIRKKLSEN